MTNQEAVELVAVLTAAYPFPQMPVATAKLYAVELERLPDAGVARDAIAQLIRGEQRLPTIARLIDVYYEVTAQRVDRRAHERGLEMPPGPWPIDEQSRLLIERFLDRPFRPVDPNDEEKAT